MFCERVRLAVHESRDKDRLSNTQQLPQNGWRARGL